MGLQHANRADGDCTESIGLINLNKDTTKGNLVYGINSSISYNSPFSRKLRKHFTSYAHYDNVFAAAT
jgi:hypothetical protein